MKRQLVGGVVAAMVGLTGGARRADACGCFTPPDPSVPVVQAGERILFSTENGTVTAHIQIQYQGNAAEFGWILPLPSVPDVKVGTDELFAQLIGQTQPKYRMNSVYEGNCSFDPSRSGVGGFGGGSPTAAPSAGQDNSASSPLVLEDSIGPYMYAVLKADSKQEMLDWLKDNRYFVPAGTDTAVNAYIRPGAYFLALKLRSGRQAGDLQPVVLRYRSDLPMIPIVLTSVAANPDMGIQVWMLGRGRAIPRNYYHTVLNDAVIDWFSSGANYNDVVIAATKEAAGRHTFVTEYAGSSSPVQNLLAPTGRFGSLAELKASPTYIDFVEYLYSNGFATSPPAPSGGSPGGGVAAPGFGPAFGPQLPAKVISILKAYIPVPPEASARGISDEDFYRNLRLYTSASSQLGLTNYQPDYKPVELADKLDAEVIQPSLAAEALLKSQPYLTRLYTTLSPEQMDRDPVFSFNASLPSFSNLHEATLTYHCGFFGGGSQQTTPATLLTADGWKLEFPYGVGSQFTPPALPSSAQIQVLSDEGAPTVVTDNEPRIEGSLTVQSGGCAVSQESRARNAVGGLGALGVALAALGLTLRRRRPDENQ